MTYKRSNRAETAQRFSLRKSAYGAASVLLGTVFLAGYSQTVQADTPAQIQEQDCECSLTGENVAEQVTQIEGEWQTAQTEITKITTVDIPKVEKEIENFEKALEAQGVSTDKTAEEIQLELNTNLDQQKQVQESIGKAEQALKTASADLTQAEADLKEKTDAYNKINDEIQAVQKNRSELESKLQEDQVKLEKINTYISEVEEWNGKGELPNYGYDVESEWGKKYFTQPTTPDVYQDIEYFRVLINTLEEELADSEQYAQDNNGQYAIVRRVADIYEEAYPIEKRRQGQSNSDWKPASVIYAEGTPTVEVEDFSLTDYQPDMEKVSNYALAYIQELRRLNGIAEGTITVTADALAYAELRAKEASQYNRETAKAQGKPESVHYTENQETDQGRYGQASENIAQFGSDQLIHQNQEFIHSDQEMAYYLLLRWFAEYTNNSPNYGHAVPLFLLSEGEFGMGYATKGTTQTSITTRFSFNITSDKDKISANEQGQTLIKDLTVLSRTVYNDEVDYAQEGVPIEETDPATGLTYNTNRFQVQYPNGETVYRFTQSILKSEIVDSNSTDGKEAYVTFYFYDDEQPQGDTVRSSVISDYRELTHAQLGAGREFTYTSKDGSQVNYFRTESGDWYKLSDSSPVKLDKVTESNQTYTYASHTEKDLIFLPKTTFVYQVSQTDHQAYQESLKQKIADYKRFVTVYVKHKVSPLVQDKLELEENIDKLNKQLNVAGSEDLTAAKTAMDEADKKVKDLTDAKSDAEKELEALQKSLADDQAEEEKLKTLLDKLSGKSGLTAELERLKQRRSALTAEQASLAEQLAKLCDCQEEAIAFTTVYEDDPTLYEGTEKVKTAGVNGKKTLITTYQLQDGKAVPTTAEKVTQPATNRVVLRGTKPSPTPVTVTEYRPATDGVAEYQVTKLEGQVTGEKHVTTHKNTLETQEIDFAIKEETDATLLEGTRQTKQTGVKGSREVGTTYSIENGQLKKTAVNRVLKEAVDEIVLVGTRQPVRTTQTSYRAIETGVEEYVTDYVDGVATGSARLVKTHTNATPTAIAFETIKEDDATLLVGETKVKQSGVDGSRLTGTIYTVVDGQLKTETVDKIVTEPVSEIILVGTKPAPQAQVTKVLRQTETGAEEVEVTTLDGVVTEKILATYANSRQETTLAYETIRQEDDSLIVGEEVVKQSGQAGSRVTGVTYTVVDGKLVTTNLDQVVQEPISKIILVGTKEEESFAIPDVAPEADELPEYVFDPADFQDVLKPESSEEIEPEVQPEPSEETVAENKPETTPIQTAFSRYAGVWVNGRGQRFTISEDGTFTVYFNEKQVDIFNISDQGVVTFTNGGPSVVLPSYLPAGYSDEMTVNSDKSLERFVFFGDASSSAYMELPADDFFYRLGAVPSSSVGNGGADTASGAGLASGAAALAGQVDDVAAVRPASLASSSEATPTQSATATSLPNTGEATSLVALLGASMLTTAGASIKRRRR